MCHELPAEEATGIIKHRHRKQKYAIAQHSTSASAWDAWDPNLASQLPSDSADIMRPAPDTAFSRFESSFLCFDIEADGFLYNMVRSIIGTLIHVGRGRWTADDIDRILKSGDRTHAGETAPAQGLYLMRVDY